MANAMHTYETLNERLEAIQEIAQEMKAALSMFKKKKIDVIELPNDSMVPDSIYRLQRFSESAAARIKRWNPGSDDDIRPARDLW